jgi:HlyD family secretion protein
MSKNEGKAIRPLRCSKFLVRYSIFAFIIRHSLPTKEFPIRLRQGSLRVMLLVGLAALLTSAAGARWLLLGTSPFSPWERGDGGERSARGAAVVCFGYVDIEHGVTPLYPLVPGRVIGVEVGETQAVKTGTVLIRLDDRLARLRLQEAEADAEAAQAQYLQAEKAPEQHQAQLAQQRAAIKAVQHRLAGARLVLARKRDLEQLQQLNPKEVEATASTVHELEAAEAAEHAKLAELQLLDPTIIVKRAKADVKAKQARLDQARRGVEECVLAAPSDGRVLRILVSPGEVLGPHPQQPAVIFAADGPRWIRAEVTQEFAGLVAVGQTASIEDEYAPSTLTPAVEGQGRGWRGKVVRLADWYAPSRSTTPDLLHLNETRSLECLIQLDADQPPLRIGRRMRVTIEATSVRNDSHLQAANSISP